MHYPPPIHGAAVIGGLIRESRLIREQFECRFINLSLSKEINEIGRHSFKKFVNYPVLLVKVFFIIVFFRPHLCYLTPYSYGKGFYKDFPIIFLCRFFGIKSVFHYHNKGIVRKQENWFDNCLYRFSFRKSHVILLSHFLKEDVIKYVGEDRIHYCANGIPFRIEPSRRGKDRKSSGDPGQKVSILFLSNLIRSKGVYDLLEACIILKRNGVNFICNIVGDRGDIDPDVFSQQVIEKGLGDYLIYKGRKDDIEKESEFEEADIFVHPSLDDCMPLVIIEAMQHSLPVVSTYVGAIPELVEDGRTGYLVNQGDVSSLAEKLMILIEDPEKRKKLGEEGLDRYRKNYTLELFEKRFLELLSTFTEQE